jgi:5'-deoxynucleotidase YfbR-like HD superfamily hydrolase
MKLKELVRLRHIKRWGIVSTALHQSVAEHSAIVGLICDHIMDEFQILSTGDGKELVLQWSLWHDVPEIVTGDIPATAKKYELVNPGALALAELRTSKQYEFIRNKLRSHPKADLMFALVRFADNLEAAIFIREAGLGPHAQEGYREFVEPNLRKHAGTFCEMCGKYEWLGASEAWRRLYLLVEEVDPALVLTWPKPAPVVA